MSEVRDGIMLDVGSQGNDGDPSEGHSSVAVLHQAWDQRSTVVPCQDWHKRSLVISGLKSNVSIDKDRDRYLYEIPVSLRVTNGNALPGLN